MTTLHYTYATNNSPPPGDKQIRTNQSSLSSVTSLYVDNNQIDGTDSHDDLMATLVGNEVTLTMDSNTTRFGKFSVSGPPIDNTDWVEIPVGIIEAGAALQNGDFTLEIGAMTPDTGGSKMYRYVGDHAQILEGGQPVAHGDYVTLDDSQITGINKMLIDDDNLIDASSLTPDGQTTATKEKTA